MTSDAGWLGSMPEIYDRCLGPAMFAPFAVNVATVAASLGPRRVLELAAGTGVGTAELVRALPEAQVVATDLNAAMVAWGQAHVAGASWQQADAQELHFADGAFDLAVCQFGVMFFPDRPRAYEQVARVLAPEGRFLFTTWDVLDSCAFPAAAADTLAEVLPDDPPTFIARVPHGYTDRDRVAADLAAGGLQPVELARVALRGEAPSARVLAEGFCLGTPLRFALEQRGDLEALTAAIADGMTARLGSGPVSGDLVATRVLARRAPRAGRDHE